MKKQFKNTLLRLSLSTEIALPSLFSSWFLWREKLVQRGVYPAILSKRKIVNVTGLNIDQVSGQAAVVLKRESCRHQRSYQKLYSFNFNYINQYLLLKKNNADPAFCGQVGRIYCWNGLGLKRLRPISFWKKKRRFL